MYQIKIHAKVLKEDFKKIGAADKKAIIKTIDTKLTKAPLEYSWPLRKSLSGSRKCHIGDYRILYEIEENVVYIYKIAHRSVVYKPPVKRD